MDPKVCCYDAKRLCNCSGDCSKIFPNQEAYKIFVSNQEALHQGSRSSRELAGTYLPFESDLSAVLQSAFKHRPL